MHADSLTTKRAKQLLDYLHSRQRDMLSLLEELVLAESPSTVPASQQPVLDLLQKALEKRAYRVRRIRGRQTGGQLLAVPNLRRKPILGEDSFSQPIQLLLGHSDTVWPLGTLAKMPLSLRQGKMYGPGIYDMKAGLVQIVFALEALAVCGFSPQITPAIFINSDEEIGSHESTPQIRRLAKIAERAFVMEPSLGPTGKLKTRRKGVGEFIIRIIGQAAHAGLEPEKGASAILELSFVVQKLFQLNDPQRGITVNVGTIDGGIRPNVVAPESLAVVDVRVLHSEDVPRIESTILGLQPTTPGTQLIVEGKIDRPPMEKSPGNQKLWQLARQAASELGIEIEQGTAGGSSDGNLTSLYTPTLDGLGAVGDAAHAPGEFVYLDGMIERSALLTQLLLAPTLKGKSHE
ncbi:MAG: M20 family metallopeptidase [Xenococcaceae cyanobacterium]